MEAKPVLLFKRARTSHKTKKMRHKVNYVSFAGHIRPGYYYYCGALPPVTLLSFANRPIKNNPITLTALPTSAGMPNIGRSIPAADTIPLTVVFQFFISSLPLKSPRLLQLVSY
jgi:hypothetical protein